MLLNVVVVVVVVDDDDNDDDDDGGASASAVIVIVVVLVLVVIIHVAIFNLNGCIVCKKYENELHKLLILFCTNPMPPRYTVLQ